MNKIENRLVNKMKKQASVYSDIPTQDQSKAVHATSLHFIMEYIMEGRGDKEDFYNNYKYKLQNLNNGLTDEQIRELVDEVYPQSINDVFENTQNEVIQKIQEMLNNI